jgi:ATPase subunit of ABC transporter with duplicated ATPase domains
MCDIDFKKINIYTGNYSFWYQASQLASRQRADKNKKAEQKKEELARLYQTILRECLQIETSHFEKKGVGKIRYIGNSAIFPTLSWYHIFTQIRDAGNQILEVENLASSNENGVLFTKIDFPNQPGG